MTRWHGVDIVFSRLADCESLVPLELSIDWQYVHSQLVYGDLPKQATAIREITQLQPGECLEIYAISPERDLSSGARRKSRARTH